MQFLIKVILFIGISSTYAAPTDNQFQTELKNALEPVQTEIRSLMDNAQVAAGDVSKSLNEYGTNILEAGRNLLSPIEKANIGGQLNQRAKEFGNQFQDNLKSLVNRVSNAIKPLINNERSVMEHLKNAEQMLEDKYLTPDGHEMVKMLSRGIIG